MVDTAPRVSVPSHGACFQPELTGWGAYPRSHSTLSQPEALKSFQDAVARPLALRGLGRSYGDPALNDRGHVLGTERFDRYLAFDGTTGVLTAESGVSLEQIITDFVPRGFFPAITPGTRFVTLGGCIANDVHGKAHHSQGTFCNCVHSMRVLLASGKIVECSREVEPDLFWGSFGGLGLLGAVLDVTLELRRIESSYFRQKAIVARDLREMLEAMARYDADFAYSVAYVDPVATGPRLGSGVLTVGNHARVDELPTALRRDPLRVGRPARLSLPFELPEFVLNPLTIRLLNVVLKAKLRGGAAFSHYDHFFYPLDSLARHWNRGYGRRGFTQYQFVIPEEDGYERMQEILQAIISSGNLPFLNVLKRFGPASQGLLSFPTAGYTFAIDFPLRDTTAALLKRLDAMVIAAGGRVYLGKDAFLSPQTLRQMYPQVEDWLALKRRYDPENRFVSDLARRLELVPKTPPGRLPQWSLS